jgi:F-type H+-transporting ATPase subunit delta
MTDTDSTNHQFPHTADVGSQRVAKVYAEALLNAAEKEGQGDAVIEELETLVRDVFGADPKIEAFFASAAIGRKAKADVIRNVFQGKTSQLFFNFLLVLNDHERLDLLRPILAAARELRDQRARRIRVLVRSAAPLPEDQCQRLARELHDAFQLEPVLETRVEPELLGGVVVKVGDWLYDGSVRNRLELLRKQLIERSSYEIQSRRDRFSS